MTVERFFKAFGKHLARLRAPEFIGGYLRERLGTIDEPKVTRVHLFHAIREGTRVLSVASNEDKKFARVWARRLEGYKDMFTPEFVLECLGKIRPDLAGLIIEMREGRRWLEGEVKRLRKFFWD